MTIYIYKDMIESLLKRNKKTIFIGFILSVLLCSCRNNQNRTKIANNSSVNFKQKDVNRDTIFFLRKNDSIIDVVNKSEAYFFRVVKDSSSLGYEFIDFSMYEYSAGIHEPKRSGYIQNLYELFPEKSIANGKWIIFGNDSDLLYNLKYHKIGYYKQGIKDSIWYTSYEDGWDEYFYYENGTSIDYVKNVKFYGYQESLVVEGTEFRKDGLPTGIWKYYRDNEVLEHEYIHQKDSIVVKYTRKNKETTKIIDKGFFIAAKYSEEFVPIEINHRKY